MAEKTRPMTTRFVTPPSSSPSPEVLGRPLASPRRRLGALFFDWAILFVPTIAVSCLVAATSLYLRHPDEFHGVRALMTSARNTSDFSKALGDIAPLLVRNDAPGLPSSVRIAVEGGDAEKAGEALSELELDFSLVIGGTPSPLPPGHVRLEIGELIPNSIRGIAYFAMALLYFTLLAARGRPGSLGKRLFGIRVVRLDDRALSYWESLERVGGYFGSLGILGLGLLDLWHEPNRRLMHDRISDTVVIRSRAAPVN